MNKLAAYDVVRLRLTSVFLLLVMKRMRPSHHRFMVHLAFCYDFISDSGENTIANHKADVLVTSMKTPLLVTVRLSFLCARAGLETMIRNEHFKKNSGTQ